MSLYQHIVIFEQDIATMSTMSTVATMQIPDTRSKLIIEDL